MVAIPDTLDARRTLGELEDCLRRRRAVEAEDLQLVAHWARLHSADPGHEPGPRVPGGNRLDVLGGDGTPGVQDLALVELGIARAVHTLAARSVTADVLDLQYRLPAVWAKVLDLTAEAWVARKVAVMTRHLSQDAVGLVDAAVAEAIAGQAPSRVFEIAEAKVIEADPAGHKARMAAEAARRFVALARRDPAGLRTVIARVTAGDGFWVDATVDRVADILGARPEHASKTRDELRAEAFGWLARPAELLALLLEHAEDTDGPDPEDAATCPTGHWPSLPTSSTRCVAWIQRSCGRPPRCTPTSTKPPWPRGSGPSASKDSARSSSPSSPTSSVMPTSPSSQ